MENCPGGELSRWEVVLVESCPSGELSWWGVVLVGYPLIVLVRSCPGRELSQHQVWNCPLGSSPDTVETNFLVNSGLRLWEMCVIAKSNCLQQVNREYLIDISHTKNNPLFKKSIA